MTELPINEKLEEIFVMSYFYLGELINSCISVFFRFSNGSWYKIILSDGQSIIERVEEPKLNNKNSNEDFFYPISIYKEIDLGRFGHLDKIYDFFWLGKRDESCGIAFEFDNGRFLYVVENDDEIALSEKSDVVRNEWEKEKRKV